MLSSRRQIRDNELAQLCERQCQQHTVESRERRQQNLAQTFAPEERVQTWSKHHPNQRPRLLLCKCSPQILAVRISSPCNLSLCIAYLCEVFII